MQKCYHLKFSTNSNTNELLQILSDKLYFVYFTSALFDIPTRLNPAVMMMLLIIFSYKIAHGGLEKVEYVH